MNITQGTVGTPVMGILASSDHAMHNGTALSLIECSRVVYPFSKVSGIRAYVPDAVIEYRIPLLSGASIFPRMMDSGLK